jgi:hypothetical protein
MSDRIKRGSARSTRGAVWIRAFAAAALLFAWLPAARAQDEQPLEGVNGEKYNIKQSVEFGGRFTSISGNQQVYDTFVNLQQGARLLGFTTEMRSIHNNGDLFDRLYVSSFGAGGDPNFVSRLRVSKNKWYNFDVLLRHDINAWDYSLQANPLNPTAPYTNGPTGFGPPTCVSCVLPTSPHLFDTARNLSDYSLLFLPQSKVRIRMGYSRNIVHGPELTSIHVGTEQQLFDQVKTTVNTYRLGVDYRFAPRSNISYDEIWNDYKGDTGATDQNQLFLLSNGTPVDIGVSLNSAANQPCGNTFNGPPLGAVNPACSAFINYLTHGRVRTKTPTEQISLQSSYWRKVDITGRFTYTGGEANEFNYLESQFGRESRTSLINALTNGSVVGQRVAVTSDLGVTWHITDALSFLDSFHYSNFHNPSNFLYNNCSFFSTNLITVANVFTPVAPPSPLPIACLPPTGSVAGNPAHVASSEPDLSIALNGGFLKQDEKTNLAELDYQFSSRLGTRVGFRYRHRAIDDNSFANVMEIFYPSNANRGDCALVAGMLPTGCTPFGTNGAFQFIGTPALGAPFGGGETQIDEYAGLFGFWAKPIRNWRISFDTELMSANNVFTRISPRQSQEYRVRSTYKPVSWANISGSIRIWEARDNVFQVNNLQHDRAYGVSAMFQPNEKFAVDVSYDYNNVFSQILICYPGAPPPPGSGINVCPNLPGLVEQLSVYHNDSHYGGIDVMWKPIRHLTAHLGGNFTGTSGSALLLNPNQSSASLNSKWLSPTGGIDYAFTKNWMGKAYWNYYGYHEDPFGTPVVPQDIFAPRNFRGNTVTLSARYAF